MLDVTDAPLRAQGESMTLLERATAAVKTAMKERRREDLSTLRMLVAAIQQTELDQRRPLSESEEIDLLVRQVKQREESLTLYRQAGDGDRAQAEEAEAALIRSFLPEPLTEAEAEAVIREQLADAGLAGPSAMGKAMGLVMPHLKGRIAPAAVKPLVVKVLGASP